MSDDPVRIADMPDIGAVTDGTSFVGEKAGSGLFTASALKTYMGLTYATTPSVAAEVTARRAITASAKDFGAVGNGATDDTVSIQAGIAWLASQGGGTLRFPGGVFIIDGLILVSNVVLEGAARGATILRGKAGGTGDIISTTGFAGLTGTNSQGGPFKFGFRHISIDGNKAARTGGNAVSIYGFDYTIIDVEIYNGFVTNLYSEWSTYLGPPAGAVPPGNFMEAHISDLLLFLANGNGMTFNGPHDTTMNGVISYINGNYGVLFGQTADYTAAGTQVVNFHSFGNASWGAVVNCWIKIGGAFIGESNTGGGGVIVQGPAGQITGNGQVEAEGNTGPGIVFSGAASPDSTFSFLSTGNTGDGVQVLASGSQITGVSKSNGGTGLIIGGVQVQGHTISCNSNGNGGIAISTGSNHQLSNVFAGGNTGAGLFIADGLNGIRVEGAFSSNTGTQAVLGTLGGLCHINIAVFANVGQVGYTGTVGNNMTFIAAGGGGTGVASSHSFAV